MERKKRVYYDYSFDQSNEVLILKRDDNGTSSLAMNYSFIHSIGKLSVTPIRKVVQKYNANMSRVVLDKQVLPHRIRIGRKNGGDCYLLNY